MVRVPVRTDFALRRVAGKSTLCLFLSLLLAKEPGRSGYTCSCVLFRVALYGHRTIAEGRSDFFLPCTLHNMFVFGCERRSTGMLWVVI